MTTFQFNHKTGLIKINGAVVGVKTAMNLNFILDTGASSVIINSKIIEDIGYNLAENENKRLVNTGKGTIEADFIQIKSLEVFGFVKENPLVLAYKFQKKINMYDGFIGLTFLRQHNICLDFNIGIGTFE